MFRQILTPVADSLGLSFLVASSPIVTVLVCLGLLRLPAWLAAGAGLAVALAIAIYLSKIPPNLAFNAVTNGAAFALWPVMWIVVNALLLYNVAVRSGRCDPVPERVENGRSEPPRRSRGGWLLLRCFAGGRFRFRNTCRDHKLAFDFSRLPTALSSGVRPDLQHCPCRFRRPRRSRNCAWRGDRSPRRDAWRHDRTATARYRHRSALLCDNVIQQQCVHHDPHHRPRANGRQLRGLPIRNRNYIDYTLTDVLSSLGSLLATLLFLEVWQPADDPEFRVAHSMEGRRSQSVVPDWQGWLPWIIVSATVIVWTSSQVASVAQQKIEWLDLIAVFP